MIKCCIFDLDGTLLNTIETIQYYANSALEKNGFEGHSQEKYKYMVGNGAAVLVKRMLEAHNCTDKVVFEKVFNDYVKSYDADVLYKTSPYDGIEELLKELKSRGIKIVVLSNKPDFATRSVIEIIFGKDYFDLVFGQRENVPVKPDPTAVYEILNLLKIQKSECIYVGDTDVDMKTGSSVGLYTVGCLWGFRDEKELLETGADITINNPLEILKLID